MSASSRRAAHDSSLTAHRFFMLAHSPSFDERTAGDELGLLVRMRNETERVANELNIEARSAALGVSATR